MEEYKTVVMGIHVPVIVLDYPNMKDEMVPVKVTQETTPGGVTRKRYTPDWYTYWEQKHKNKPEFEQLLKVYGKDKDRINSLCIRDGAEHIGLYGLLKRFKMDVALGVYIFKDEKIYDSDGNLLA
jgi:hypothetical protein